MSDINETKDLYPSIEEIEGLELASLDKEEAILNQEEDEDDKAELDGMGDLGRSRSYRSRWAQRRARRLAKRRAYFARRKRRVSKSMFRAYNVAKSTSAVKVGLTKSLTSKGEFELRRQQLPADIQKALKEARMQTVDGAIYTIKSVKDRSDIDLMEASDDKKAGVTNINRAQLDNGKYFLLTDIVLEYAHGADANDNNPADFEFGQSALPAEMINGTFEMTLGTKVIVPEISTGVFDDTDSTKRKFQYKLSNPKWLKPAMDITPKLNMTKAITGVDNPAVKVTLLGTMTEKA